MNQFNQMLKQAQKIQAQMAEVQEKLDQLEVVGAAGGGMVQITVNGKGDIRRVKIDPSLLVAEEVEVLEDLIVAAYRDAKGTADRTMGDEMGKVTGGLSLPPGFNFPLS